LNQIRKSTRGLTLIELLIGMMIALVIMAIVGLVLQSARTSFVNSEELSAQNNDERNTSRLIIDQVKFATNGDSTTPYVFKLYGTVPGTIPSGYDYVYFGDQSGVKGLLYSNGGTAEFTKLKSISNISFSVVGSPGAYSLVYKTYDISNNLLFSESISLLNVDSVSYDPVGATGYGCVVFKRP